MIQLFTQFGRKVTKNFSHVQEKMNNLPKTLKFLAKNLDI